MSHILRSTEVNWPLRVNRPYAAVRVKVVSRRPRRLDLDPDPEQPVCIITDVEMAPLPDDVEVWCGEQRIEAEHHFFITVESMNPFHLLIDAPKSVI